MSSRIGRPCDVRAPRLKIERKIEKNGHDLTVTLTLHFSTTDSFSKFWSCKKQKQRDLHSELLQIN